jgi:NADPH:quinone reductase-like Zn-dependent oxidoreductase
VLSGSSQGLPTGYFDLIIEGVGGHTLGLAIEHVAPRGVVVKMGTQSDDETVTFRARRFDRARGARIYTLNLLDELASHASGTSDFTRLCGLMTDGRLDGQVELRMLMARARPRARRCAGTPHRRQGCAPRRLAASSRMTERMTLR